MGPDSYQVEVLHYLNPHIIWVEVLNRAQDEFVFEQIGIYGILPTNTTIDINGVLKTEICNEWIPAATVMMKEQLLEAEEVWFCPTYIDRRGSIFDDNIHKYGNLIIKKPKGTEKNLTSKLKQSGFAMYDECLFHQSLTAGHIKTNFNHHATQLVVKQIERHYIKKETSKKQWEKSVKKQMTVYNETKNLEASLTRKNLELHDRENIAQTLQNKMKDLAMCKEADEESVGRAASRRKTKSKSEISSIILKKRLQLQQRSNGQDPLKLLLETKKYLDANSLKRNTPITNSDTYSSDQSRSESSDLKSNTSQIWESKGESNFDDYNLSDNQAIQKDLTEMASPPKKENWNTSSQKHPYPDDIVQVTKVKRKAKKPNNNQKSQEFDSQNEKRILFGPPDIDPQYLTIKIVPKDVVVPDEITPIITEPDSVEKTQCDDFADMDSEVNLKITNIDVLKSHIIKPDSDFPKNKIESNLSDVRNLSQNENILIEMTSTPGTCVGNSRVAENSGRLSNSLLQRKLHLHKEQSNKVDSSISSSSETNNNDGALTTDLHLLRQDRSSLNKIKSVAKDKPKKIDLDSDDESISDIIEKLGEKNVVPTKNEEPKPSNQQVIVKNSVNPFKNLDGSNSVFVDKLVSPILMVHTKHNNRIQPRSNLRDIPFGSDINIVLQNMSIKEPMRLQTVSWCSILRGHSLFMISPLGSGKTMGYIPAVCRLVADCAKHKSDSVGPTSIILCATAKSVTVVEKLCKMFLGIDERVFACFPGIDELQITTSLLNGCDLMVCTPPMLYRLIQADFGVDLRRLRTLVLDDCERVSQVYDGEIKIILHHVKEMMKSRADKKLKVQYVIASRNWCNFMEPLCKKAPDTVVCIGSFQECVLYSKTKTSVNFVMKENKVKSVVEFIKEIDGTKRTVIACRCDEEVELLEKALTKLKYVVFAVNNTMTVQDLYNINVMWGDYQEPLLGPILVCCDGNLNHLNVTNANYLIHFSMPELFSTFCKRFSVLNDNYPSIFRQENEDVRIKIFLEETNVEQLPKILHFVKRCSNEIPAALDQIAEKVLENKDLAKADNFVPICSNLLTLGQCPDFWNCQERHVMVKEYDETKEWVPRSGLITFKILHYHSAVQYSARLLSHIANGTTKFPQTYSTLSLKMGMYFSKDTNRKLHGVPKLGDVCAMSIKQNFFARCQVLKILNYQKGFPHNILVKLIDEERLEVTRDVYLYHLPDDFKKVETHVLQVRLANVQPQDKDITFSNLARDHLRKITENDENLYVRGQIALSVGNCVFVDTLEACQDLSALSETVVKFNLKRELLDAHAQPNSDHIKKLVELCKESNLYTEVDTKEVTKEVSRPLKVLPDARWAHLESDDLSCVFFASAEHPGNFFIRLLKFNKCIDLLVADIKHYISENPQPVSEVTKGDFVLAEFPDDSTYERARIDDIIDDNKARCFFVDNGDWRDVATKNIFNITEKFITRIPFQAIECRLIGVKPVGENWTDFSTNWLCDNCYENDKVKPLYVKYFIKEKAECTGGHKYGVALIDTTSDKDITINKSMIDLNLAQKHEYEIDYLNEFENKTNTEKSPCSSVVNETACYNAQKHSTLSNFDDYSKNKVDEVDCKSHVKHEPPYNGHNAVKNKTVENSNCSASPNESSNNNGVVLKNGTAEKDDCNLIIPYESLNNSGHTTNHDNNAETPQIPLNEIFLQQPIRSVPLVESGSSDFGSDDTWDMYIDSHLRSMFEPLVSKFASSKNENVDLIYKMGKSSKGVNVDKSANKNETESKPSVSVNGKTNSLVNDVPTRKEALDSDDLSSSDITQVSEKYDDPPLIMVDQKRKPKLIWRQNKTSVSIKIQLIGADNYELEIKERSLKFYANLNDINYEFDFELYGVIDWKKSNHSNKGQYILVNLFKVLQRSWLNLTKDFAVKKWIVPDFDAIDTSSEEEEAVDDSILKTIKDIHEKADSDSDDDEFMDDAAFSYKRNG